MCRLGECKRPEGLQYWGHVSVGQHGILGPAARDPSVCWAGSCRIQLETLLS